MAGNSVTLELNGTVSLDVLGEELRQWSGLLREIGRDVARREQIHWIVDGLHAGSALATAVGVGDNEEAVERVVKAYSAIGRALRQRRAIPGSWRVQRHALALIKPLRAGVESIRFETDDEDILIVDHPVVGDEDRAELVTAHGSVTGRIQTLSSRRRLGFTLYDSVFDRAVNCYLAEGQEDMARDKWDRRARVAGLVSRDPSSGRPVAVRQIQQVEVLPEPRDDAHERLIGLVPHRAGEESAAETIRRIRDAW